MKVNRTISVLIVVVIASLALWFPTQTLGAQGFTQPLLQLPEEGIQLILFLLTAGVAWALLKLSEVIGLDLAGYVQPVVAVLAPIIVAFIEKYLGMIPSTWDDVVLTIIHLIVLLVGGAIGTFVLVRKVKKQETKALLTA